MFWSELHLGAPLPEWGPLGEQRRELLRHALEEAVETALEHRVDAVLCSGDLFDRPDPEPELAQFTLGQFAQLVDEGTALVLLPGRYDSLAHPHAFYHGDLPKEICVVDWAEGRRTQITTPSGPLQLYSLVWRPGSTPLDFWKTLHRQDSVPGPHVGLLHAHAPWSTVPLANGLSVTMDAIAESRLDLLVLGGPHNYRAETAGNTQVVAPGTPTGLGFGEWGDRRWCIAALDADSVSLETTVRDVPPVLCLHVDVRPEWTLKQLTDHVVSQISEGSLIELHLTGRSPSPLVGDAVLEALAPLNCVVDLIDEVEVVLPRESAMNIRDLFIQNMQARMAEAGEEAQGVLRRALKQGLKAASGREIAHAD